MVDMVMVCDNVKEQSKDCFALFARNPQFANGAEGIFCLFFFCEVIV